MTDYTQLELQRLEDQLDKTRRLLEFQNGIVIAAVNLMETLTIQENILSEAAITRYCALRDALNTFYRA